MKWHEQLLGGTGPVPAAIAVFLLLAFSLSVALVPIRADNDCWWHVKTGMYIDEHGLPTHDVFSYTAADYEWHNHEWLTQLAAWRVFRAGEASALGGWRAVILATAIVIAACYTVLMFLARRLSGTWWIALLVAVIAVDASRRTFYPRPPVVSNLLLAIELLLLIGVYSGWFRKWWLLVLPPMIALWTNLHGGWMAGIVVLVCFLSQDIVRVALQHLAEKKPAPFAMLHSVITPEPGIPLRFWAALFPLCILATLCNPYGYHLYALPARVMSDDLLVRVIGELLPPTWKFFPVLIASLTLMALAFVILVIMSIRTRAFLVPLQPAEWVLFCFFLYQGVNHVRHLLLFGVMLVPLVARLFGRLLEYSGPRRTWLPAVYGALAIVVGVATLRNWPEADSYVERNRDYFAVKEGYIRANYPADVCDLIELVGFNGRMFNEDNYAGYLIWRLSPETHKVFSDSRFDIFGSEILRQAAIISSAFEPRPGDPYHSWRELLDHWNINWLLIKAETDLSKKLSSGDEGWVLVGDWTRLPGYRTWQIWVRDTPENAELISRARRIFQSTMAEPIP